MILNFILNRVNKIKFRRKWRMSNAHNLTYAVNVFPIDKVKVGKRSYGPLEVSTFGNRQEQLTIGNYVSIANDVQFILGGNHRMDTFSNFPIKSMLVNNCPEEDALVKGKIEIKDEVWIGTAAIIMSGVTVGKGAVIAAGAVVVKDVPDYAIFGGNPAKLIRYRFDQEVCQAMSEICLSDFDENTIISNQDMFYKPITMEHLMKIKELKNQ